MNKLTLKTHGRAFTGWTSVSLTLDVRAIAWSFDVGVTQPTDTSERELPKPGQAVTLIYDNEIVMTGYIDDAITQYDALTTEITLSGRSKTGQLVDSAAIYQGGQFVDMTLLQIAQTLCKPFDIRVIDLVNQAGVGILKRTALDTNAPFNFVRIEQGESVFDLLERLARQRGVLLTTNPEGDLVITQTGKIRVTPAIRLGENILAARGLNSIRNRASEYIVKGSGSDITASAEQNSGNAVVIKDEQIRLYRPRLVICEQLLTHQNASIRGNWQRCRDLGEGSQYQYTIRGWQHDNGTWKPNTLVSVRDGIIGLNKQLLIVSAQLSLNDEGELTTLTVQPPEALVITKEQTFEEALWA